HNERSTKLPLPHSPRYRLMAVRGMLPYMLRSIDVPSIGRRSAMHSTPETSSAIHRSCWWSSTRPHLTQADTPCTSARKHASSPTSPLSNARSTHSHCEKGDPLDPQPISWRTNQDDSTKPFLNSSGPMYCDNRQATISTNASAST